MRQAVRRHKVVAYVAFRASPRGRGGRLMGDPPRLVISLPLEGQATFLLYADSFEDEARMVAWLRGPASIAERIEDDLGWLLEALADEPGRGTEP